MKRRQFAMISGAMLLLSNPIMNLSAKDKKYTDIKRSKNVLWFKKPADHWTRGIPLGNGRLGCVVFGEVKNERIILNEDTLWGGVPDNRDMPEAKKNLKKIRELIFQRKYEEAEKIIDEKVLAPPRRLNNRPVGDLSLKFDTEGDV